MSASTGRDFGPSYKLSTMQQLADCCGPPVMIDGEGGASALAENILDLSQTADYLRELEGFLGSLSLASSARDLADGAGDRIRRDLLPRTELPASVVVVAIVGPNNSGKSTLFNELCGHGVAVSPASPTGGFTRACVAALAPETLALARSALSRRFELQVIEGDTVDEDTVRSDGAAQRLLAVPLAGFPEGLVLVDAPDFDSVYPQNRLAGEAILVSADVLVAVVTPHTYQNRACVDFLRKVVRYGRPYCLVYNEAQSQQLAQAHLAKLVADLGAAPVATFFNVHDRAVQDGCAALRPLPFDSRTEHVDLHAWIRDTQPRSRFLAQAREASWLSLEEELRDLTVAWSESVERPRAALERARLKTAPTAERAARALLPLDPFREALRHQLDERSGLHHGLRILPRQVSNLVRGGYRLLAGSLGFGDGSESPAEAYRRVELDALLGAAASVGRARASAMLGLWGRLHGDLLECADLIGAENLEQDFSDERRGVLAAVIEAAHAELPLPFADFQKECEFSIGEELDRRGTEAGLQWMYTGLSLLPPVAAVAVMAATGVVGDVGAGVAYLTSQPMIDRAVGREFVHAVHERWWKRRADSLTVLLLDALAPRCVDALGAAVCSYDANAGSLAALLARLPSRREAA